MEELLAEQPGDIPSLNHGDVVEGTIVPPKSLILGSPAKVKRPVAEKELAWIKESAENYVRYASQYMSDSGKNAGFKI